MTSALDDIIVVIDWLAASKTPTGQVAEALDRLRKRAHDKIPVDVKLLHDREPFRKDGDI